jgi:hypothetical protein
VCQVGCRALWLSLQEVPFHVILYLLLPAPRTVGPSSQKGKTKYCTCIVRFRVSVGRSLLHQTVVALTSYPQAISLILAYARFLGSILNVSTHARATSAGGGRCILRILRILLVPQPIKSGHPLQVPAHAMRSFGGHFSVNSNLEVTMHIRRCLDLLNSQVWLVRACPLRQSSLH